MLSWCLGVPFGVPPRQRNNPRKGGRKWESGRGEGQKGPQRMARRSTGWQMCTRPRERASGEAGTGGAPERTSGNGADKSWWVGESAIQSHSEETPEGGVHNKRNNVRSCYKRLGDTTSWQIYRWLFSSQKSLGQMKERNLWVHRETLNNISTEWSRKGMKRCAKSCTVLEGRCKYWPF